MYNLEIIWKNREKKFYINFTFIILQRNILLNVDKHIVLIDSFERFERENFDTIIYVKIILTVKY